jgi:hypothetical protein
MIINSNNPYVIHENINLPFTKVLDTIKYFNHLHGGHEFFIKECFSIELSLQELCIFKQPWGDIFSLTLTSKNSDETSLDIKLLTVIDDEYIKIIEYFPRGLFEDLENHQINKEYQEYFPDNNIQNNYAYYCSFREEYDDKIRPDHPRDWVNSEIVDVCVDLVIYKRWILMLNIGDQIIDFITKYSNIAPNNSSNEDNTVDQNSWLGRKTKNKPRRDSAKRIGFVLYLVDKGDFPNPEAVCKRFIIRYDTYDRYKDLPITIEYLKGFKKDTSSADRFRQSFQAKFKKVLEIK